MDFEQKFVIGLVIFIILDILCILPSLIKSSKESRESDRRRREEALTWGLTICDQANKLVRERCQPQNETEVRFGEVSFVDTRMQKKLNAMIHNNKVWNDLEFLNRAGTKNASKLITEYKPDLRFEQRNKFIKAMFEQKKNELFDMSADELEDFRKTQKEKLNQDVSEFKKQICKSKRLKEEIIEEMKDKVSGVEYLSQCKNSKMKLDKCSDTYWLWKDLSIAANKAEALSIKLNKFDSMRGEQIKEVIKYDKFPKFIVPHSGEVWQLYRSPDIKYSGSYICDIDNSYSHYEVRLSPFTYTGSCSKDEIYNMLEISDEDLYDE